MGMDLTTLETPPRVWRRNRIIYTHLFALLWCSISFFFFQPKLMSVVRAVSLLARLGMTALCRQQTSWIINLWRRSKSYHMLASLDHSELGNEILSLI